VRVVGFTNSAVKYSWVSTTVSESDSMNGDGVRGGGIGIGGVDGRRGACGCSTTCVKMKR
jgi:hypothetical protein